MGMLHVAPLYEGRIHKGILWHSPRDHEIADLDQFGRLPNFPNVIFTFQATDVNLESHLFDWLWVIKSFINI